MWVLPIRPLIALGVLHVPIVFAGFFAPYSSGRQNRDFPFVPPTRVTFLDAAGKLTFRPLVHVFRAQPDGSYVHDRGKIIPVRFFVVGDQYQIAGFWPLRLHLFGVEEPELIFLIGTDDYGRDQLSRFLWGGQVSLLAGLAAASFALLIGASLGAVSGFYGRPADDIVMAVSELFLALPWFYMLIGFRAVLPLNLEPRQAFLMIISLLGVIGWARPARLVRGVVLSAKQREFVWAARGFGASDFYLLRRHVLPQVTGVLLTQGVLLIPQFALAEVTMTFLGLGVNEPAASWGLLLASLQQYQAMVSHWWMWLPAFLPIPVFVTYYSLASALDGTDTSRANRNFPRLDLHR